MKQENEDKVEITGDSKQRWDEDTFDRLLRERQKVVQRMGECVNAEMPMQVLGSLMTSFPNMEDK